MNVESEKVSIQKTADSQTVQKSPNTVQKHSKTSFKDELNAVKTQEKQPESKSINSTENTINQNDLEETKRPDTSSNMLQAKKSINPNNHETSSSNRATQIKTNEHELNNTNEENLIKTNNYETSIPNKKTPIETNNYEAYTSNNETEVETDNYKTYNPNNKTEVEVDNYKTYTSNNETEVEVDNYKTYTSNNETKVETNNYKAYIPNNETKIEIDNLEKTTKNTTQTQVDQKENMNTVEIKILPISQPEITEQITTNTNTKTVSVQNAKSEPYQETTEMTINNSNQINQQKIIQDPESNIPKNNTVTEDIKTPQDKIAQNQSSENVSLQKNKTNIIPEETMSSVQNKQTVETTLAETTTTTNDKKEQIPLTEVEVSSVTKNPDKIVSTENTSMQKEPDKEQTISVNNNNNDKNSAEKTSTPNKTESLEKNIIKEAKSTTFQVNALEQNTAVNKLRSEITEEVTEIDNRKPFNTTSKITEAKTKDKTIDKTDYSKTIKMNNDDITFFVNLVENPKINIQQTAPENVNQTTDKVEIKTEITQKSVQVSQTLLDALNDSMKTNRPLRIDFDKDIAVIMKVDKDGVLSANFIPGSAAVENYLRNNMANLRQNFDNQNLPYNQLSYSNQQKGKQSKQNKENDNE